MKLTPVTACKIFREVDTNPKVVLSDDEKIFQDKQKVPVSVHVPYKVVLTGVGYMVIDNGRSLFIKSHFYAQLDSVYNL